MLTVPRSSGADPGVLLPARTAGQLEPFPAGSPGGRLPRGGRAAAALGRLAGGVHPHQPHGTSRARGRVFSSLMFVSRRPSSPSSCRASCTSGSTSSSATSSAVSLTYCRGRALDPEKWALDYQKKTVLVFIYKNKKKNHLWCNEFITFFFSTAINQESYFQTLPPSPFSSSRHCLLVTECPLSQANPWRRATTL